MPRWSANGEPYPIAVQIRCYRPCDNRKRTKLRTSNAVCLFLGAHAGLCRLQGEATFVCNRLNSTSLLLTRSLSAVTDACDAMDVDDVAGAAGTAPGEDEHPHAKAKLEKSNRRFMLTSVASA